MDTSTKQWDPTVLAIAATIRSEEITSMDFHKNGRYLVMSTKESALHLVDCQTGTEKKKILLKTNGAGIVRFTHHETCVLVTSERKNEDIRYVSITDNKYLRYFRAHSSKVVSLAMSPANDIFISASKDGVIHMWNLGLTKPIGTLQLRPEEGNIRLNFDPNGGAVFAVMTRDMQLHTQTINLFGSENYDTGPFLNVVPSYTLMREAIGKCYPVVPQDKVEKYLSAVWTEFEFAPDGRSILVNTNSDLLLVLDAFSNEKEPLAIVSRKNENGIVNLGMCYSADGRFILAANDDKEILVLDAVKGHLVIILGGHLKPVKHIKCNPKYDVMASSCSTLALWISPLI